MIQRAAGDLIPITIGTEIFYLRAHDLRCQQGNLKTGCAFCVEFRG